MIHQALIGVASLSIAAGAVKADGLQSDWSGGPGDLGPVIQWGDTFLMGDDVAWRSIPGQLALAAEPRDAAIAHFITDDGLHEGIAFGDLNGDGLPDMVSARPTTDPFEPVGAVYWWERTSDGQWIRHTIDETFQGSWYQTVADIDGDGDLDVAVAAYYGDGAHHDPPPPNGLGRDGHYVWFENLDGDGSSWERHYIAHRFWGARWIEAGDVDGDGDIDLVGASELTDGIWEHDIDIAYMENLDGAGTEWLIHDIDSEYSSGFEAHLADLDDDGDLDIVGTDYSRIAWYENRLGQDPPWIRRFVTTDFFGSMYCDVGDIDGDGDMDIMGSGLNTAQVAWFENTTGSGTVWFPRFVVNGSGGTTLRVRDVDGDGDLDAMFARRYIGDAYWIESVTGDGVVWDVHLINAGFGGQIELVDADINRDGRLDAAVVDEGLPPEPGGHFWFDLTTYKSSGSLISTTLDGGDSPGWSTMSWQAAVEPETSLVAQVRASNDPSALGPFADVPTSGTNLDGLIDTDAQFLQYRLLLESSDPGVSPIVEQITLTTAADVLGDLDGDGVVAVGDLLILLADWGDCPDPPAECSADLDDNGTVDVGDLLTLLANWN